MTRREEIQWEAGGIVNRMIHRGVSEHYDTYYQAFQDGATWADKTMLEKACVTNERTINSNLLTTFAKSTIISSLKICA